MSFSQQSRSDLAAAEADARRKQLGEQSSNWRDRSTVASSGSSGGLMARFRAWVRRALHR
jgi:hypothetical protein